MEDDRQGAPKKVMAEVLGEAARLAGAAGAQAEAVWVTDKATPEGLKQLGEWGAKRVWLFENAAFAPYRAEVWTPVVAELAAKESPQAIFAPVTTRQREFMARLAARLGAGLAADSTVFTAEGGQAGGDAAGLRRQAAREDDVGEDAVDGDAAAQRVPPRRRRGRRGARWRSPPRASRPRA